MKEMLMFISILSEIVMTANAKEINEFKNFDMKLARVLANLH